MNNIYSFSQVYQRRHVYMLSNFCPVLQERRIPKKGERSTKTGGFNLTDKPAWLEQAVKEYQEREAAKKNKGEVIDTSDD